MSQKRSDADEFIKRNAVPDDDVEGHRLRRDEGDGHARRGEGESAIRRNAIPDDGEDVEGHSMLRGDDGIIMRGGDELARRVGPGEGHIRRD